MESKAELYKKSLASLYEKYINEHPFINTIFREQNLTKGMYVSYLRETYFLVTQTPYFLGKAAGHTSDSSLQKWFLKFALEESGHNQLCLKDLKMLGVNSDGVIKGQPGFGAWAMIAQCHYLAETNPIGLIGFAIATEGLGADLAGDAASSIDSRYPYLKGATNFLKVHGHEDQEHFNSVLRMYEKYAEDEKQEELINSIWVKTIRAYSQLFTDVMSNENLIEEFNFEVDEVVT